MRQQHEAVERVEDVVELLRVEAKGHHELLEAGEAAQARDAGAEALEGGEQVFVGQAAYRFVGGCHGFVPAFVALFLWGVEFCCYSAVLGERERRVRGWDSLDHRARRRAILSWPASSVLLRRSDMRQLASCNVWFLAGPRRRCA